MQLYSQKCYTAVIACLLALKQLPSFSTLCMFLLQHRPMSKLIRSRQDCNYQFDHRGRHITRATCTEKHVYSLFSHQWASAIWRHLLVKALFAHHSDGLLQGQRNVVCSYTGSHLPELQENQQQRIWWETISSCIFFFFTFYESTAPFCTNEKKSHGTAPSENTIKWDILAK